MNNTLISVVVSVTPGNCHEASKAISSYWDQLWMHKQLIVVNMSEFTFGNTGYTEIAANESEDNSALMDKVVSSAKGEFIVEWRADQKFSSTALQQFMAVARHSMIVNGYVNNRHVATFFSRKVVSRRESLPHVRLDLVEQLGTDKIVVEPELGDDKERLNVLCAGGIGDVLWVLAKFGPLVRHNPDIVLWLPFGEQHRSGALARMCGVNYGYMHGLTTHWVWNQPSQPDIPERGWVPLQANRHLESGKPLSEWYPELPVQYPPLTLCYADRPAAGYVVVFMCVENYMGGQLQPHVWANILRYIEDNVGPVLLVGADRDVQFADQVTHYFKPSLPPMFDRPLEEVVAVMLDAKFVCGVASGLLITAIVYDAPSLISYPTHLASMPGTWEPEDRQWGWCFQKDLPQVVLDGGIQKILNNETVHRHLHL